MASPRVHRGQEGGEAGEAAENGLDGRHDWFGGRLCACHGRGSDAHAWASCPVDDGDGGQWARLSEFGHGGGAAAHPTCAGIHGGRGVVQVRASAERLGSDSGWTERR